MTEKYTPPKNNSNTDNEKQYYKKININKMGKKTKIMKSPTVKFIATSACVVAIAILALIVNPIMLKSIAAQTESQNKNEPPIVYTVPLAGFGDLVEQVQDAVVSIKVEKRADPSNQMPEIKKFLPSLPENHPFFDFFKQFEQFNQQMPQNNVPQYGQGSGFIISSDGYIVTNNHVIDGADEITVILTDGGEFKAQKVGVDEKTDIALLKIGTKEKTEFPYVSFADNKARVGDWVIAIGNPFGLGGTVSTGIVSATGREIGAGPYDDFIQIDAPINRGNSGGPAFNLKGEVIGVNTSIISPSGGSVGIGFAIPAELVRNIVDDLKDDGKIARGWLGVRIQEVTKEIAESVGFEDKKGVIIAEVIKGTPAQKNNLNVGDIILQVDEKNIDSPRELARHVAAQQPGETINVKIMRNGEEKIKNIKIDQMPSENITRASNTNDDNDREKISLADIGLTLQENNHPEHGKRVVIADVIQNSHADQKGLKKGDVIIMINGKKVENTQTIQNQIEEYNKVGRKKILLGILPANGKNQYFVALPINKA